MQQPDALLALVADIGGTNTRVALARGASVLPDTVQRFRNAEFPGLEPVLQAYLATCAEKPVAACVAMAGPVHDGRGTLTNLDWSVDRDLIAQATGTAPVAVLNDLQAQGHALGHIALDNLRAVAPGVTAGDHAARLVLGVGTGLNAALVFRTDAGTLVPPSESGHITLPVQDAEDLALWDWISAHHEFPGVEEVLSGRGLERLYAFYLARSGAATPTLSAGEIMAACTQPGLARDTVARFVQLLGRVTGNLALIQLPFGGIYLVGGVARAMAPHLGPMGFAKAFCDKGRFAAFMDQFPIWVVEDDYAALTGCAAHLSEIVTLNAL